MNQEIRELINEILGRNIDPLVKKTLQQTLKSGGIDYDSFSKTFYRSGPGRQDRTLIGNKFANQAAHDVLRHLTGEDPDPAAIAEARDLLEF